MPASRRAATALIAALAASLAAGLVWGVPAIAAPPGANDAAEENEPLVMRLIFQDCLNYVRRGQVPFAGLPTRPASAKAIEGLPALMPDRQKAVELISPRYVASWGVDANARHCVVKTVSWADDDRLPMRLGVRAAGFTDRVDARARAEGLRSVGPVGEFSPLVLNSWSEREDGPDTGPQRPVSFSVIPSAKGSQEGVVDAGMIVMGGPSPGTP